MKKMLVVIAAVCVLNVCSADDLASINYLPAKGVVPDSKVAVQLAEVILKSVYGVDQINGQLPLQATLLNSGNWLVTGTFKGGRYSVGGVAEILIRKKDGATMGMIHGK